MEFVERETGEVFDFFQLERKLIEYFEMGKPAELPVDPQWTFFVQDTVEAAVEGICASAHLKVCFSEMIDAAKRWGVARAVERGDERFIDYGESIALILTHIDVNYRMLK